MKKNKREDLWNHVDTSAGPDGCWPYLGSLGGRDRRGQFGAEGEVHYAHRLAYELVNGPLKNQALHTCDLTYYCNPKHIYDGTQKQNIQDRTKRGRDGGIKRRGESNGNAKLSDALVVQIRQRYIEIGSYRKVAKEFGVHFSYVGYLVRGKSRRNVSMVD